MANQHAVSARAVLRDVRITPQKARRVIDLIRGQKADEALTILKARFSISSLHLPWQMQSNKIQQFAMLPSFSSQRRMSMMASP